MEEAVAPENIAKQATSEIQSRFDGRNNIAFYGTKENKSNLKEECEKLDKECINDILTEIGIHAHGDDIKNLKRFGKKGLTKTIENKDGTREDVEVPRVIIGTFTEEAKIRIMKNAHQLSSSKSDYYRTIGIKHDMTKEIRQRDKDLKKEAAKDLTEKETEKFVHVVRGIPWERRIVQERKCGGVGALILQELIEKGH
ncbi:hypothetical protein DPMN_114058 [Dreissena polymorpha]|uniref:Uncharacterized protein n=1 Tax=Dreissena polymorpha TaxID=45954 RepID=A0A9D4KJ69_DREPO|nr:hypothetical protein DPMN_114058 [Dreissena polymorpha]